MRHRLLEGPSFRSWVPVVVMPLLAISCGGEAGAAGSGERGPAPVERGARFVEVTEYEGIDFVHTMGDDSLTNIVETVGSGAAFLDYDGDGRPPTDRRRRSPPPFGPGPRRRSGTRTGRAGSPGGPSSSGSSRRTVSGGRA